MLHLRFHLLIVCLLIGLGGCSSVSDIFGKDDQDILIEGERISILELERKLEPDDAGLIAQGLIVPEVWTNQFWPQSGGYPNHAMQNLSLNPGKLTKVWSVDIGRGATDELPLTAQPIVVDGEIFVLDTDFNLSAFDIQTGKLVWRLDVSDPDEDDPVIGGGLAYDSGVLYVTNGFRELLAIQPAGGKVLWRVNLPAPSRAAPTIMNGRVFVATLDSRLVALDSSNGNILWEYVGIGETAGLVGAASPAANNDIVVPVFSSGEMTALRVENGSVAWSDNLSGLKRFGGLEALSDIKALPVLDRGLVIGASFGGRIVAIDERTGNRIWQRELGSANTPWVAGNHIFLLSTDNQLAAIGRDTGAIRWITKIESQDKDELLFLTGPVFAGGRLILIGTEGLVIEVDPENGNILRRWRAGKTVSIAPIVAGQTLYLLDDDGRLSAYR